MPIQSYLIYTDQKKKENLAKSLNDLPHCQATVSSNEDVIVLLTDTKNKEEEENLQKKLKNITELTNMTLVFARES